MEPTSLEKAQRYLDRAASEAEREERLYYLRQAHQLVIASEEQLEEPPRIKP